MKQKQNILEVISVFFKIFLKAYTFCRDNSKRDKKSQVCIGIDQPQDKPFTSSDEQHLDTESYLMSPSISPYAGSRVDSVVVKIPYKGDEKNPTVKKSHVHENSAMVSDKKRSLKKEHRFLIQ